jgi:chromosome segregation ATPase
LTIVGLGEVVVGKKKAKKNGASTAEASGKKNGSRPSSEWRMDAPAAGGAASTAAPQNGRQTELQRRREKMLARTRAVQDAEQEVSRLEQHLDDVSRAAREQESALTAATARVADLEQALMTSHRERTGLQAALEQVRGDVARARERAGAAERKYDRAVLEEVVRREKAVDLTLHAT